MKTVYCTVIGFFFLVAASLAQAADIVSIATGRSKETIEISIANPDARVFRMERPERLVVDFHHLQLRAKERQEITLSSQYKGKYIKALRVGQFDADTVRFVFDLRTAVEVKRTSQNEKKVIIEIAAMAGEEGYDDRPPLIVIDPGHGGRDPGTIAADGTQEKDVVLEYAKALQSRLLQSGQYQVMLTRDDDEFIVLRKRFAIARDEKASLFISLHADSAPEKVRGLSLYTLSEKSSDEETEALAARENKSDILADVDLSGERQDVADILISLAQRETMNRSAALADHMVVALEDRVQLLANSHRFAGFAVLIELGFLSHPQDSKLLKTKVYREKVVDGIADGVDAYFRRTQKGKNQ